MLEFLEKYALPFIGGIVATLAAQYLADFFTDKRRSREQRLKAIKESAAMKQGMPELIHLFRKTFAEPHSSWMRVISPYPLEAIFAPDPETVFISPTKIPNLERSLRILQSHGFLEEISEDSLTKFRTTAKFAELLSEN